MRQYPRSQQIEAFRAVKVGSVSVATTVTRIDPSPDPERRRIDIANSSAAESVLVKVANVGDAAPTITAVDWHYRINGGTTLTLDVGPEVAVYGLSGGFGDITVQIVEY